MNGCELRSYLLDKDARLCGVIAATGLVRELHGSDRWAFAYLIRLKRDAAFSIGQRLRVLLESHHPRSDSSGAVLFPWLFDTVVLLSDTDLTAAAVCELLPSNLRSDEVLPCRVTGGQSTVDDLIHIAAAGGTRPTFASVNTTITARQELLLGLVASNRGQSVDSLVREAVSMLLDLHRVGELSELPKAMLA